MRRIMLAGTALVALSVTSPVLAQAQTADNANPTDIVVTAQKRPERMKDIPVAASVVSSALLAHNNATDITDLNKLVPSVEMKGTFNGRVPLGIRGISTNANEAAVGLTSGVAIEIDGVPVPPDSFAANQLDDVTQIEVLKGPQATLGGRTASAGVINIVTGSPSKTLKGKVSMEITDDSEQRFNASISGPITKSISFSLSGFDTHVTYPIYNLTTGLQSDSTNVGVRGKLKFEITPDFDATIMGRYSKFKGNGDNFTHQYVTPGAALFPYIDGVGISQAQAFPGMSAYYGNMNTTAAGPDMYAVWEDTDASLTLNYRTGGLTISSTTAYQKEKQNQLQHVAESAVYFWNVLTGGFSPWSNNQLINNDVKQFTQEFKVASDTHKPVSFLAGAFYSNNEVDNNQARQWFANDEGFLTISKTKTYAAYARVTGKIAENTSITGGLRYNHDQIYFQKTQFFDPSGTPVYWMGCGPENAMGQPVAAPPTCVLPANSSSSDTLVGDISVQQHFGKDQMVYASYTRGYKPAAYNTAQDFYLNSVYDGTTHNTISSLTLKPTKKETIDSFEIGAKLSLFDRKATLNLAAFHTTYNDYQVQIFPIVNGGLSPLQLLNGKARTQGIEADLDLRPARDTHIAISAAYIDAKFLSFANAPCYPGQHSPTDTVPGTCVGGAQDLSGHAMPDAPKLKLDVDLEQRFPLGSSELVLGGNVSYRTSANFQANGDPYTVQPAFAIVNLSAGVDFVGGKYNVTGFVNNVFNKFYLTNAEDFFSGLYATPTGDPTNPFASAVDAIGQPARDAQRYFGARLTAKF